VSDNFGEVTEAVTEATTADADTENPGGQLDLQPSDVATYTNQRMAADDPLTAELLTGALAAARDYCEWHVTPVITNFEVTLDGPGSRILVLPTLRVETLNSVTEHGVSLSLDNIQMSAAGPVRLRKINNSTPPPGAIWGHRWSHLYSSIIVNMDHGYDTARGADFRLAVLDCCDRFALEIGRGDLQRYTVDDVVRIWFKREDVFNSSLLDPYRLNWPH
jgi:hypothetical protein